MAATADARKSIGEVIQEELDEIMARREARNKAPQKPAGQQPATSQNSCWKKRCDGAGLIGISISGGGIRSGTFALGVLQALAEKNLLQQADYLSTVSGGGYIGSWLQGILNRSSSPDEPYRPLTRKTPGPSSEDPITFLRRYSNYLSPRHGLSVDAVLIPVIWMRNMILNQAILIAAFLAAFLVSFWPGAAFAGLLQYQNASLIRLLIVLVLAAIVGGVAVWFMARNLSRVTRRVFEETPAKPLYSRGNSVKRVWLFLVMPVFLALALMMEAILSPAAQNHPTITLTSGGVLLFVLFFAWQAGGGFVRCYREQRRSVADATVGKSPWVKTIGWAEVHLFWMSAVCAGFTLWLLYALTKWILTWLPTTAWGSQAAIAWGPPLYVLALTLGGILQIGLMGRDFPDASREWLSRTGTLMWITAVLWAGYFGVGVFAPYGIAMGWRSYGGYLTSALGAWLATTAATVWAGNSAKTGSAAQAGNGSNNSTTLELMAQYGPFVAIAGFLVVVAFAAQWLIHGDLAHFEAGAYWRVFQGIQAIEWSGVLVVAATAVFLLLSVRVNINEFSMHHFYKNRLVRCYLGASAAGEFEKRSAGEQVTMEAERQADWFTGFDPKDDIALSHLVYSKGRGERRECPDDSKLTCSAPYPIVNATLNVTTGTDLATQDRKGLPWIFTPLYSGFASGHSKEDRERAGREWPAETYAPTAELCGGSGITLGTAMAISGAALNPNSGFYSSPQTAFLLTLFDVRLGWWIGNPGNLKTFRRAGPRVALLWLFRELFGDVNEGSDYLNLSDGGCFENLGLYELVRRRCRYVIAVDGEEDPDYLFESLGGAVRKCRSDFGAEIVINPRPIQLRDGTSSAHCVVGRIYYPEDDQAKKDKKDEARSNWLLYIKASITGDEPADVEEYRRENPDFPQESTVDQFFTEAQFESYRMLGSHAGRAALDRYDPKTASANWEELFEHLAARWEVPPQAPKGVFGRHAEAYAKLMNRLADHPELAESAVAAVEGMPENLDQKSRMNFLFWLDVIQLAENIFVDLNFADQDVWEHPTYAGWRQVFRYWAGQEKLKGVWKAQRESFGEAFRYFFDDLIGLPRESEKSLKASG